MRDSISDLINKISEYLDEHLINQHVCCNRKKPNLPTSHISTTQPKRHLTNPKRRRIKQGLSPTHFFVKRMPRLPKKKAERNEKRRKEIHGINAKKDKMKCKKQDK